MQQQTTARQADSRCHDGVDGQVRRIKEGLSRLPTQRHLDTYPTRYVSLCPRKHPSL